MLSPDVPLPPVAAACSVICPCCVIHSSPARQCYLSFAACVQMIKPGCCFFVVALAQTHQFSSMCVRRDGREKHQRGAATMSWDPVYRLVKQIPRGRVLSYGAVARILRLPGGARSAGRAMAATPSGKGIPWHRVVGEGGKILIREPYASLQRKLLESEGVKVLESRVDLKAHLWSLSAKGRAQESSKSRGKSR